MQYQRKAATRRVESETVRPALRAAGAPLDQASRQWTESRFAHDFSRVRVHGNAPSAIMMKEQPLEERARELARNLSVLISSQEDARKTMRKEQSRGPVRERMDQRRSGDLEDLTGIGRIQSADRFAAAVRSLQTQWSTLKPKERAIALAQAAGDELEAAGVPRFLKVRVANLEPNKATFTPSEWQFSIDQTLVESGTLDHETALKVTNAAFHESRHAEQHFQAARHAAGRLGKGAWAIGRKHEIPRAIARLAQERKFDETTDDTTAQLGAAMYGAHVEGRKAKQAIVDESNRTGKAAIKQRRAAEKALKELEASPSERTLRRAQRAYGALVDAIHESRPGFAAYMGLPSEMDASEAGESAVYAFEQQEEDLE